MLNCCIERKKAHEQLRSERPTSSSTDVFASIPMDVDDESNGNGQKDCSTSSDDDDDEFFECVESSDEASGQTKDSSIGGGGDAKAKRRRSTRLSRSDARSNGVDKRRLSAKQKSDDDDMSMVEDGDTPSFTDTLTHQPEGRLRPYNDLYLVNKLGDRLFVPITQEPAPLTEDMLEEQAEVLAKLVHVFIVLKYWLS